MSDLHGSAHIKDLFVKLAIDLSISAKITVFKEFLEIIKIVAIKNKLTWMFLKFLPGSKLKKHVMIKLFEEEI